MNIIGYYPSNDVWVQDPVTSINEVSDIQRAVRLMKASKASQSTNKESVLSRTEERGKGRQGNEPFSPQK